MIKAIINGMFKIGYECYWLDRGKLKEWASLLNVSVSESMSNEDIKTALRNKIHQLSQGANGESG